MSKSLANRLKQVTLGVTKNWAKQRRAEERHASAEANRRANAIAQAMLQRGMGPDTPIMILSGNSILRPIHYPPITAEMHAAATKKTPTPG